MKAAKICSMTRGMLKKRKIIYGRIHSTFNRACNIITEDDLLIPLISSQISMGPRAIALNIPFQLSMIDLGFNKQMKVFFDSSRVCVDDIGLEIDISNAKEWDGSPALHLAKIEEDLFKENLKQLIENLFKKGNLQGIAPVLAKFDDVYEAEIMPENYYCNFIYPRIVNLLDCIFQENMKEIANTAKRIIGFGPGLTPAADDFIAGMMISMVYSGNYYGLDMEKIQQINGCIIKGTEHRTTKVSAEMLYFAAEGKCPDNVRRMMMNLFSKTNGRELEDSIISVINNGETSGSDLIGGIYAGCTLIIDKTSEGAWWNEGRNRNKKKYLL